MRLRHKFYLFHRPVLLICILGSLLSLMACGAIPTLSEPTTIPLPTDTPEAIATLSLPTFTVIVPTATFPPPTNTIPLPTLTSESSATVEVAVEITETPEVTATSQVMVTSKVTVTSEITSTVTPAEVEEASPTIVQPTETVGTATPTIVLPTFTPQPNSTTLPLATATTTGNNPTPIPAPTETQTPLEPTIEVMPTQTQTQTPLEPTIEPTIEATIEVVLPDEPDANQTPTTDFFAALPLDAFTALPKLETLDYNQINPAQPTQYWELRFAFPEQTTEVIGSSGSRDGIDGALLMEFDSTMVETGFDIECLPAYCFKYIVSISNNQIQTWQTIEELNAFLAPIDSAEEGILLVAAHEYNWSNEAGKETGSFREVADGYEFIVTKLVNDCDPVQTDRYLLHLSTSGTITVQHSEIWTQHLGMCI